MKPGFNADLVIQDMQREQYYKNKAKRQKCIIDEKKQCDKCKYNENCIDSEVKQC